MKKNIIIILAVFIVPMIAYWGLTKSNSSTAKNVDTTKPQVIKFSSTMCIDCQKMQKVFQVLKPKYESKITFIDINVQDKNSYTESQIKKYNITLVPTIILLDSKGKQVKRIEDAIPQEQMENYIKGLE